MSITAIVAVEYSEPDYKNTVACLDKIKCLKNSVQRKPVGTGSLAEAYNLGFDTVYTYKGKELDYVWFVSNIQFDENAFTKLVDAMDATGYAAIHPAFESDHLFLRPDGSNTVKEVPYVEFTAPIVRADVFAKITLDENMPYWGHDLDWSYRVKQLGYKVGVHHGVLLQHKYIRQQKDLHHITRKRYEMRKQSNEATTAALIKKYGHNWQEVLGYKA